MKIELINISKLIKKKKKLSIYREVEIYDSARGLNIESTTTLYKSKDLRLELDTCTDTDEYQLVPMYRKASLADKDCLVLTKCKKDYYIVRVKR